MIHKGRQHPQGAAVFYLAKMNISMQYKSPCSTRQAQLLPVSLLLPFRAVHGRNYYCLIPCRLQSRQYTAGAITACFPAAPIPGSIWQELLLPVSLLLPFQAVYGIRSEDPAIPQPVSTPRISQHQNRRRIWYHMPPPCFDEETLSVWKPNLA